MKTTSLFFLFLLCTSNLAAAQTQHTVHFDKGVYKPTINRWIDALDRHSKISSTTYIAKKVGGKDSFHQTGHRDLIVWIPRSTDLSRDFKVILWFHGHWGYIKHRTFQDRILKQFSPQALLGKQFVVVLPEMPWSINTKTPTKRNGQLWQKPGDFIDFMFQVESILLRHKINSLLEGLKDASFVTQFGKINYRVVGHSAGGSTIATIAVTGDLCKISPTMVVWSDSSYSNWLSKAWDGCLGDANIPTEVFVRKWGSPYRRATEFLGQFQGQPEFLHLHVKSKPWTHKKIGNNIVEISGVLD
jgi:hypothetical protein